jgi:hypothetical protein
MSEKKSGDEERQRKIDGAVALIAIRHAQMVAEEKYLTAKRSGKWYK